MKQKLYAFLFLFLMTTIAPFLAYFWTGHLLNQETLTYVTYTNTFIRGIFQTSATLIICGLLGMYFLPLHPRYFFVIFAAMFAGLWMLLWPAFKELWMQMLLRFSWQEMPSLTEDEKYFTFFLIPMILVPALLIALSIQLVRFPPRMAARKSTDRDALRAKSSIFGDARLGQWKELSKRINRPHAMQSGEIVLGEDYDPRKNKNYTHDDRTTWGKGGKAPLIKMDTRFSNGHSLIVSGSGGGKTAAYVIPTCMSYRHKLVVVDPDGEALSYTRQIREQMGRTIIEVNLTKHIDILSFMIPHLTTSTAYRQMVDNMLLRERDSEFSKFYATQSVNFLAGLFEFFHAETDIHPLEGLSLILAQGEDAVRQACFTIMEASKLTSVQNSVATILDQEPRILGYTLASIASSLSWLQAPDTAAILQRSNQENAALADPNVDIFITMHSEEMRLHPGLVRMVLGCFAYDKMHTKSSASETLMIVDEAALFGYFSLFEMLRDRARKHRLHLMLIYQGIGQIIDAYGRSGANDWKSVAARAYSRVEDEQECEIVSRMIGSFTAKIEDKSQSESSRIAELMPTNVSQSSSERLHKTQLVTPDEIRQLPQDAQILLFQGQPPLICGKAFHFRRNQTEEPSKHRTRLKTMRIPKRLRSLI